MPIFMDRHDIKGSTAEQVAGLHQKDLQIQEAYGIRGLTYWFDASRGAAFCLIEAPDAEAIDRLHREAHGDSPTEIIEVDPASVELFLGRTADPETWASSQAPPEDSAFRAIMFTDIEDSTAMNTRIGDVAALELIRAHDRIVRDGLTAHAGREVKHTGDGIMASFGSAVKAVQCAIGVQRTLARRNDAEAEMPLQVRIGVSAGEPVADAGDLFGSAVQLAARICAWTEPGEIAVSHAVHSLCVGKRLPFADHGAIRLKGFDDPERVFGVDWSER